MYPPMKQRGRVNFLVLVSVVTLAGLVAAVLFASEPPENVAYKFMTALSKGDVEKLTDLSVVDGDREAMRKQWDYTVHVAAPYYRFVWALGESRVLDDTHASVKVEINPDQGQEPYHLAMEKVDGKWKVRVQELTRDMFPYLPH